MFVLNVLLLIVFSNTNLIQKTLNRVVKHNTGVQYHPTKLMQRQTVTSFQHSRLSHVFAKM